MKKWLFAIGISFISPLSFAQNYHEVEFKKTEDEDRETHYWLMYTPNRYCKFPDPARVKMKVPRVARDSTDVFSIHKHKMHKAHRDEIRCIVRYDDNQKAGFWVIPRPGGSVRTDTVTKPKLIQRTLDSLQTGIFLRSGREHFAIRYFSNLKDKRVLYKIKFFVNILPQNKEIFIRKEGE